MSQCPAGFHQPAAASVFCVPCDAGTSSDGTLGAAACTRCPAGTASSTGSATCTPCSVGEYQPANKSDTCKACTAGKFQDATGATSCIECPSGRAQSDSGEDKCDECQVINIFILLPEKFVYDVPWARKPEKHAYPTTTTVRRLGPMLPISAR